MNIIEPGIRNLATAKDILLTPYGLDESPLTRTLAEIFTHKVDYADLYFQSTRSEAWSLEEGIVKSGSFSIDQGVGVRAVSGDRTAFAYSDDLSPESIRQAALATRAIAKAGGGKQKIKSATSLTGVAGRDLYLPSDPLHVARRHRQGQAARTHRKDGARPRSAHRAGHGRPRRRIRRRAGGTQRRRASRPTSGRSCVYRSR